MKKIAILGPPGAGKSTMAKELKCIHNINIYHLDRILWKHGWIGMSEDTRIDILQKLVGEEQWIIEGSYFSLSELRLEAADTIIFLDMPFLLCLHRLFERHRKQHDSPRRDIPSDSTDKLGLKLVLRVLSFSFRGRTQLLRKLAKYEETTKRIVHLHSPEEVSAYLMHFNGTRTITVGKTDSVQQEALSHYNFNGKGRVFAGSVLLI